MGMSEVFFGGCLNECMAEEKTVQGVCNEGMVSYALVTISKSGGRC